MSAHRHPSDVLLFDFTRWGCRCVKSRLFLIWLGVDRCHQAIWYWKETAADTQSDPPTARRTVPRTALSRRPHGVADWGSRRGGRHAGQPSGRPSSGHGGATPSAPVAGGRGAIAGRDRGLARWFQAVRALTAAGGGRRRSAGDPPPMARHTASRQRPRTDRRHERRVVNYPTLPRSGLLAPRLLRVGLPVSVSKLASVVDTAAPDSAGGFPLGVVWSVPLLPVGHSATTDGACLFSHLNTVGGVVSIVLPSSSARVVSVAENVQSTRAGAVSPPCSRLRRSLRKGH